MLYRFRSVERLLNDRELQDNYFYFASPSQQNDPMEGYVDFYWKGDKIAWLGLFKHYAWQLYMTEMLASLGVELETLEKLYLTVTEIGLKEMKLHEVRKEIEKELLGDSFFYEIAEILEQSNHEFSIIEVQHILFLLHFRFLKYVSQRTKSDFGLEVLNVDFEKEATYIGELEIKAFVEVFSNNSNSEDISEIVETAVYSFGLFLHTIAAETEFYEDRKKFLFFMMDFPKVYVKRIQDLSFPNWYCVCFNKNVSNPALWGYYANSHKGVCLVFKNDEKGYFKVKPMNKEQEKEQGKTELEVYEVKYGTSPIRIEFFSGLGRLWDDERKHWLMHDNKYSIIWKEIQSNADIWRESYNKNSMDRLLRKSKAWEEEQEYRIILDDSWYPHKDDNQRMFQYDFNDLDGIIFGINTPLEQKLEIINIITDKCVAEKRKQFTFYQATYDSEKNYIVYKPVSFINHGIKTIVQNETKGK